MPSSVGREEKVEPARQTEIGEARDTWEEIVDKAKGEPRLGWCPLQIGREADGNEDSEGASGIDL